MRRWQKVFGLLACALAYAGCGGSDSGGRVVTLEQLPTQLGKASCAKIYQCCTDAERAANPLYGETQEDCEVVFGAFMTLFIGQIQASVTDGRVAYHGEVVGSCLSEYQRLTCEQIESQSAEVLDANCGDFLVPKVAIGGACTQDYECIDGYCNAESAIETCAARKANGDACTGDAECVSDYCDATAVCAEPPPPTTAGSSLCGTSM